MKKFVLILLLFIGIFTYMGQVNAECYDNINDNTISSCEDIYLPHEMTLLSSKTTSFNNTLFEVTSVYYFFARLNDKYNKINNLIFQKHVAFLKSLIKHKSSNRIDFLCSLSQIHDSKSLYKCFSTCDFYTYHLHRIII